MKSQSTGVGKVDNVVEREMGGGEKPTRSNVLSAAAKAWLTKPLLNWDLVSTN